MAVVHPAGMIDDRIKANSVDRDVDMESGIYLLTNVAEPFAAWTALNTGFGNENGVAIPRKHFPEDAPERPVKRAGASQRGEFADPARAFEIIKPLVVGIEVNTDDIQVFLMSA